MSLDFNPWLLPIVFVAVIVAFVFKKKKWVAALWIPAAAVVFITSFRVLQVVQANSGQGMEALGGMFALIFGLPWFVLAILAAFGYPRRWSVVPSVIGGILVIAGSVAWPKASTQPMTVQVLDPSGKPVPNYICFGISERDRVKGERRSYITDSEGRFSFRYDPKSSMSFRGDGTEEWLGVSLSLSDQRIYDSRSQSDMVHIAIAWTGDGSSDMSQNTVFARKLDSEVSIPLYLKSTTNLVNPALQGFIGNFLKDVREDGGVSYDELGSACSNFESLDLIAEVAAIVPAQPQCRQGALRALDQIADKLYDIHKVLRHFPKRQLVSSLSPEQSRLFAVICRWANTSPAKAIGDSTEEINQRISFYANQLIVASRPYWGDEDSSAGVVEALGDFGRIALADFPSALKGAHPRGRRQMLFALERLHPTVAEVEWAVSSNEPDLVAAAYDGARENIKSEEMPLAVERLLRINNPGANTRAQMQVKYLLPAFGYNQPVD